ncbi:hypothetical protein MHB42_07630 [Lysinibacillus sp. FSL K6-0232]|uniref:hypothetical protein n=1 Tax=Lysinibacillus sp. FSL K6-0232 TaxID=2921425 RepID=UPI0030F53079
MMIATINKAIQQLPTKYRQNELAYISLTGKNESFIRDQMALYLYRLDKSWCREYKRIDLAQLSTAHPTMVENIIEITSLYTSDIVHDAHFKRDYLRKIKNDMTKNGKYTTIATNTFIVMIATHLKDNKRVDDLNIGYSFACCEKENALSKAFSR